MPNDADQRPTSSTRRSRRLGRESLRKRVERVIVQRFMVRFHMMIMLLALVAAGVVASKLLLMAGMTQMATRWPTVVLIAYGLFFLCVKLWLRYVKSHMADYEPVGVGGRPVDADEAEEALLSSSSDEEPQPRKASYAIGDFIPDESHWRRRRRRHHDADEEGFSLSSLFSSDSDSDSGEAMVVIALVILVAAVLIAAIVFIVQAPAILAEAGAEVVLAGVVGRRLKREQDADWEWRVFAKTWWIALILMVIVFIAGAIIDKECPEADDAPTAWETCT